MRRALRHTHFFLRQVAVDPLGMPLFDAEGEPYDDDAPARAEVEELLGLMYTVTS